MAEFKLSYTASQVNERLGRIDNLAEKNELPKKTSDLINDSDFTTKNYVKNYAQPAGSYALSSDIAQVKQEAVNTSNTYTDKKIKSVLVYVNDEDIDALF